MDKSTSDESAKIPGRWGLREPKFFADCENEPVIIHLVNGEVLRGFITGLDMYGIALEVTGSDKPVWIMKHSISHIERE